MRNKLYSVVIVTSNGNKLYSVVLIKTISLQIIEEKF